MRLRLRRALGALVPERAQLPTLALYVLAGALYVTVGLINDNFLLSMPVGAAYLLIVVWLVPWLVRRLR